MTVPTSSDQLQAALGHQYTIEREVGHGGMATVYLARDAKHHRSVALKVLHADLAAGLGPERFRREIAIAATLQHPHILTVLDSGETSTGLLWFTMPYVEGESLRARLDRDKQLPLDDALRITREVADALDYAHQQGIIHRDIKPENILLSRGHALVADFGVARAISASDAGGAAPRHTLTETGMALGTPAYMSPEQATGERAVDARTDIYALGCVLYEMLSGEPPYTGATTQALLAKRVSGDIPSVRRVRPAVPLSVDATLTKALAPVPADRYATVAEFARALDTAARTANASAPHAPVGTASSDPAPRSRFPMGAALLGLGVLIGAGFLFAWRTHERSTAGTAGPIRIAVLPFDNLGDTSDTYFADGMTDAVRGKLTAVADLQVIATTSSNRYRRTTKTPEQIGNELGVRYLLVGRVRWDKHRPGGLAETQVLVEPELMEVRPGAAPTSKWSAPFDTPLTSVFEVQAQIAERVAQALAITLSPVVQRVTAAPPTRSIEAYDAYLRAEELLAQSPDFSQERRAITEYREALRRDPAFALAWAHMADSYLNAWAVEGGTLKLLGDSAAAAAERALALDPDLPMAHAALGGYYLQVTRDEARALDECQLGLLHSPDDPSLLVCLWQIYSRRDRFDQAQVVAQRLNVLAPGAPSLNGLGLTQWYLHNFAEASATLDRAIAQDPTAITPRANRAGVAIAMGSMDSARAILRAVPAAVDSTIFLIEVTREEEIPWALDSGQQRRLLTLGPDAFGNDTAQWALRFAQLYSLAGNRARSRAYADTALRPLSAAVKQFPGNVAAHVWRGLALAYTGRRAEADSEELIAAHLAPTNRTGFDDGPAFARLYLAYVYTVNGESSKAVGMLDSLLRMPYKISRAWLRVDPNFAPLLGNPRFDRLIAQPATTERPAG